MKYFTGRYQGSLPIMSNDEAEAYRLEDADAAVHIARLLGAIYGVRFIAIPDEAGKKLLIERE